ncbi:MAG: hypothetical protein ACMXYK_04530 [Candidatus Woesearchaeota archaeon]
MVLKNYAFETVRAQLLEENRKKISESVGPDNCISQAIATIADLDKIINILCNRVKEWYELYNPEDLRHVHYEVIVDKIIQGTIPPKNTMGGKLSKEDLAMVESLAHKVQFLMDEKEILVDYIRNIMQEHAPTLLELCGPLIGAKLIAHKGSLRDLAFLPSSTIQILGAEKALFRHLTRNARSPKYGYILQHQKVAQSENKGKAARKFASEISFAVKKDYFKQRGAE